MAARKKIKVKDNTTLVRDSFSKAIINVDRSAYSFARNRKRLRREKDSAIASLQQTVEVLKAEQAELLKLVKSLLKKA